MAADQENEMGLFDNRSRAHMGVLQCLTVQWFSICKGQENYWACIPMMFSDHQPLPSLVQFPAPVQGDDSSPCSQLPSVTVVFDK